MHSHRLLPARPALGLAGWIGPGVRRRRNSAERRDGERFMADLLLHTPRAAEANELAARWLVEKSKLGELFWRPWLLERSRILDREHWNRARRPERGCLFVTGHIGGHWSVSTILLRHGIEHYAVSHPHHWEPMPPGYKGLAKLHLRREYLEKPLGGSRIILSDGPPERPLRLLEAGNSLMIAFDVAGSAATPFLGRSVALAGSTFVCFLPSTRRTITIRGRCAVRSPRPSSRWCWRTRSRWSSPGSPRRSLPRPRPPRSL